MWYRSYSTIVHNTLDLAGKPDRGTGPTVEGWGQLEDRMLSWDSVGRSLNFRATTLRFL